MSFATTDLSDQFPDQVQICDPIFRDFGGANTFHGQISTLKCIEDNALVRQCLSAPGAGRVLVVDGGGSLRSALLGDQLGQLACDNGWAGLVIFGCIRDAAGLATLPLGIKALAAHPRKSGKMGWGTLAQPLRFAGVEFRPGAYLYADEDGILVADAALGTA